MKQFGYENAKKVIAFHRSFPKYKITPLASESNLAASLGLKDILVKDESYRFGLNAFKVLGGSYAIGSFIAKRLGMDISELPYEKIISREIHNKLGDLTFVTATDGNHGRGVAWTANRLNQKSVVYMPKGSAQERLDNIRALGSDASITDMNYDDAVRLANSQAEEYWWIMVQDTAWEGYEDIPAWIMQGYTTMAYEAVAQLKEKKIDRPTHIFLQAGVGALSGGLTGFFADLYDDKDACGEPCTIGWNVLHDHADNFVSVPDYVAAKGMRVLGNPLPGDNKVISGESGAATLGFVAEVMQNPSLDWLREQLKLDENSTVLCFSTEGDTDKANYRRIVWDGQNPSF